MEADADTRNKTLGRGWESWRRELERLIIGSRELKNTTRKETMELTNLGS